MRCTYRRCRTGTVFLWAATCSLDVAQRNPGSCTFSITKDNLVGRIQERSDGSADARGFGGSASLDPPYDGRLRRLFEKLQEVLVSL